LDLNTASQAQLERLPGIGPELAGRIIAYRQSVGRFVAKEQIVDVEGIGEKRYADLEQLITVEVGHENSGS
jgi:competence protein ComEA